MAAADGQLRVTDANAHRARVQAQFVDPGQGDEMAAVDPYEPAGPPALLQCAERDPHQVASGVGVQPGVVALRLGVGDVLDGHEADHTAPFDRYLVGGLGGQRRPLPHQFRDPADGLGEPLLADGFEDVVDGLQVEGLDGEVLVGGDEDDQWGLGEAYQQPGDIESGQPGHMDVEEDHIDGGGVGRARVERGPDPAQRVRGTGRPLGSADPRIGPEQVEQLFEGGFLVVHGQYTQHVREFRVSTTYALNESGLRYVPDIMRTLDLHRDVGAYALGVLDAPDAFRFEDHLMECPQCTLLLADFDGLKTQLDTFARRTPEGMTPVTGADPELLTKLLGSTAAERRRGRRRRFALVAVAAVLAVGAPFAVLSASSGQEAVSATPLTARWAASDRAAGTSAVVTVAEKDWGTDVGLELVRPADSGVCSLVVVGQDGSQETVTTWAARTGGRKPLAIRGGAALRPGWIDHFEVRCTDGVRLVVIGG